MITMKKYNTNRETVRSPLMIGATIIVTSILIGIMFFAAHLRMDTSTKASGEVSDVCTTSLMTSTSSTSTTSSTTTTTKTTTTTTVTTTTKMTETTTSQMTVVVTEPTTEYVEPEVEPEPTPEPTPEPIPQPVEEPVYNSYSESDAVLLAQLINKEASASYDGKVAVGSVVINRANYYGQTISQVIYAPGQFTTCYSLGYYTDTDYQAAVQVLTYGSNNSAYFFNGCHPDCLNWFYDLNYTYLFAA